MPIYPVPTGRSSNALVNHRLVAQLASDQQNLMQVQEQIATGQRFSRPSQDTAAANRAVGLQRLIELKTQFGENLTANQAYLDASDSALSEVSGLLADVRGMAVRAADTTTSEEERSAIAMEIQAAVERLALVGNKTYKGRYLFAGSDVTMRPFEHVAGFVSFEGNDGSLRSMSDIGLFVEANAPGQEMFGAVSNDVKGIDLNPRLTADTRLADLHGGQGIATGSFIVSDGTNRTTVDISSAETLGDVARLIEDNPPAGRQMLVTIDDDGILIEIDAVGGGSLMIYDEAGGTTASSLGIARAAGPASAPIDSGDLDPKLRLTTLLSDVTAWDQTSGLQIVNGGETFVIDLQDAVTVEDLLNKFNNSGAHVLAEINAEGDGVDLRSRLSGADFSIGENGGTTATDLGLRSLTSETTLSELNYGAGVRTGDGTDLIIQRTDGVQISIDISDARTVGDVIDRINQHPDNLDPANQVTARLVDFGNGMELVDDNVAGTEPLLVIREPSSFAGWDLGLVPDGEMQSSEAIGPGAVISGNDVNPIEVEGIFNSLIRLQSAVQQYDVLEIERAAGMLDVDTSRLNLGRAALAIRSQSFDSLRDTHDIEQIDLQSALSSEIDVDLAAAISIAASQQATYEASLRSMANIYSISLMDFI